MRLSIPVNFRFESNADCGGNYLVIFSADDYCVDRVRGGIPQQQNTQPSSICSAMTLLLRHGNCEWRIAKCKFKVCAVCARCRAEFLFLPNIFCAFDAKADTFSGIPYSVFILFNIRHTHARARSKSKNSFHTSDVQSKILLILIHLRTYRINFFAFILTIQVRPRNADILCFFLSTTMNVNLTHFVVHVLANGISASPLLSLFNRWLAMNECGVGRARTHDRFSFSIDDESAVSWQTNTNRLRIVNWMCIRLYLLDSVEEMVSVCIRARLASVLLTLLCTQIDAALSKPADTR